MFSRFTMLIFLLSPSISTSKTLCGKMARSLACERARGVGSFQLRAGSVCTSRLWIASARGSGACLRRPPKGQARRIGETRWGRSPPDGFQSSRVASCIDGVLRAGSCVSASAGGRTLSLPRSTTAPVVPLNLLVVLSSCSVGYFNPPKTVPDSSVPLSLIK